MGDWLLLNEIIYRPIFNLLIIFLDIFRGNLGIAIILLTLTVRVATLKQTFAQQSMQKGMSDLQPKLNEIQEKYKNNPEKLSQETMKVFKTHGAGPLKGCLMMLIQIPIFIGLFYVIKNFADNTIDSNTIYSFLYNIGKDYLNVDKVNTNFFGMDLLATKNLRLTVFAAVFTFLQMQLTNLVKPATPAVPGANMPDMSKMMGFMGVFMTFIMASFVYSIQAGVGIYIATTSLFSVGQYVIQYRALLKAKRVAFWNKKRGRPEIIGG